MSSRASRKRKKINSDNDSLKLYDYNSVAVTGPVPYDEFYDYTPNGIHYISSNLDFFDNNYFIYDDEKGAYDNEKLWKDT